MKDLKAAYKTIEQDHFAPEMEISFIDGGKRTTLRYEKTTWTVGGEDKGLRVIEGVYAFTSGPVFETPAEIRAYGRWGADIVGMSTVPEATFAHACGMSVAGLSVISNMAAGIGLEPLKHEDVLNASKAARPAMAALIDSFVRNAPLSA